MVPPRPPSRWATGLPGRPIGTLADHDPSSLVAAKNRQAVSISVVLPARDEAGTVGTVVSALRRAWQEDLPLVDEIVVMDSTSTDDTPAVATAAGARVVCVEEVASHLGVLPGGGGTGDALWTSLAATVGDLLVFLDADLVDVDPRYVPGLLGPLLTDPGVGFVKGLYDRPPTTSEGLLPAGGGRVTELLARPLINALWPELAGVVQPLGGEYAGRRTLLERVPFVCGYGVELGLLIDLTRLAGVQTLAQVDLGARRHRHQGDAALGCMAGQVLQTALARLPGGAPVTATELVQFVRAEGASTPVSWDVGVRERPPMAHVRAALVHVGPVPPG